MTATGGSHVALRLGVSSLVLLCGLVAWWFAWEAATLSPWLVGVCAALAWMMWIGHAVDTEPPETQAGKVLVAVFCLGSPVAALLGYLVVDPASARLNESNWVLFFGLRAALGLALPVALALAVLWGHHRQRVKTPGVDRTVLAMLTLALGLLVGSSALPEALDLLRGPTELDARVTAMTHGSARTVTLQSGQALRLVGPTLGVRSGDWRLVYLRHTQRLLRAESAGGPAPSVPAVCAGSGPVDCPAIGPAGTLRALWAHGVLAALGLVALLVRWVFDLGAATSPLPGHRRWPAHAAAFLAASALLALLGLHEVALLSLFGKPACARVVDARTWITTTTNKGKTTSTQHYQLEAHAGSPAAPQVFLVDVSPRTFNATPLGATTEVVHVPWLPSVATLGRAWCSGYASIGASLVAAVIACLVALAMAWPSRSER